MCHLYNPTNPSRVWYGTDTRAFLLLMGILLALVWPHFERMRRALPLLELFGVAALVATVLLFRQMHDYDPTLWKGGDLAAAFCFMVLIAAVAHPGTGLGEALGVQPLRWLGERSYGIYLWHWPVIELMRPGVDISWTGPGVVVAQAAIVLTAAELSYRFVEQPIRTGSLQRLLAAAEGGAPPPGARRRDGRSPDRGHRSGARSPPAQARATEDARDPGRQQRPALVPRPRQVARSAARDPGHCLRQRPQHHQLAGRVEPRTRRLAARLERGTPRRLVRPVDEQDAVRRHTPVAVRRHDLRACDREHLAHHLKLGRVPGAPVEAARQRVERGYELTLGARGRPVGSPRGLQVGIR